MNHYELPKPKLSQSKSEVGKVNETQEAMREVQEE